MFVRKLERQTKTKNDNEEHTPGNSVKAKVVFIMEFCGRQQSSSRLTTEWFLIDELYHTKTKKT